MNKGCMREGRKLGLMGSKGCSKGNIDVKEQAGSSCEGTSMWRWPILMQLKMGAKCTVIKIVKCIFNFTSTLPEENGTAVI